MRFGSFWCCTGDLLEKRRRTNENEMQNPEQDECESETSEAKRKRTRQEVRRGNTRRYASMVVADRQAASRRTAKVVHDQVDSRRSNRSHCFQLVYFVFVLALDSLGPWIDRIREG